MEAEEEFLIDIESEGCRNNKEPLKKLYSIWNELCLDTDQKTNRARSVWNHVYILLQDIYEEENYLCETIKVRIATYAKNIHELALELAVNPKEPAGSLVKKEELLRQELNSLTKLKHKRIKGFQELKKVESKYCKILDYKEHQLPPNTGVPAEKDLIELEQHVNMLREEHERRSKKYYTFKKELTTIFETTELYPESSLEKEIMSSKETVSLSNETFKAFEEIIQRAHKKKSEMEAEKKVLFDKLSTLWQRLQVEDKVRSDFLSKHADCRMTTIKSMEQELERCEKIKRDNLSCFITALRRELKDLWDKCNVPENERHIFHLYQSTEVSDEVLTAHEKEVEKWKQHYSEIEHILKKIDQRKELWELMIVFENKAADPNRFKNRKGNLLQEERERKRLQKELPALEHDIFKDIEAYETENGSAFLYNGEDFRTFVTNQWTERINHKENLKQERHQKHLLANETTPSKRPLKTTPKSAPSKLFKSSAGASVFRTPLPNKSKMVPSTVGKLISKFSCRPSTTKKKDQQSTKTRASPRILKAKNHQDPPAQAASADSTTYTNFEAELNTTARHKYRSSVLAGRVRGGTRVTQNKSRTKRKSATKSLRKSLRNTSKAVPDFTPARGKLGLPFLI